MKEWWQNLQVREQRLLMAGGALLALLLVYALIWAPLVGGIGKLETSVAQQRETLAWMQKAAAEVKALRAASGRRSAGLGGRSLLAVVDQTARAAGLGGALKRVQPQGDDSVRVQMESASFDAMMRWLRNLLTQNGVFVTTITVERADAPGLVNVRATLNAAGA